MNIILPRDSNLSLTVLHKAIIGCLGLLITFGLFVIMARLIQQNVQNIEQVAYTPVGPVIYEEKEEKTRIKTPVKPPEEISPPPPRIPEAPVESTTEVTLSWQPPEISNPRIEVATGTGSGITDKSARPVVQIEPAYPPEAAREGIEGWVELQFTIDATGNVRDIVITGAEPKRIFDRAARKALSRWKYQPKIVAGTPQAQEGMKVLLSFNLDNAS